MKMLNYTLTVDEDKMEAMVQTDGLKYADYDTQAAYPKALSMLNLAQSTAVYAHYTPIDATGRSFREYTSVMAGLAPFTLTSRVDFNKTLYDPTIKKNRIKVKVKGGSIGNSSHSFVSTMFSKCGQELLTNATLLVNMDTKTRKPASLPEWWKLKYSKLASHHKSLNFKRLATPSDALTYDIRVLGSDLDSNGHTSWMNYMRFAEDAIYHHIVRDKLPRFKREQFGKLESLELMYGGESFEGDILNVFTWEHEDVTGVIYAQIYKDSAFIFQGRFQYFTATHRSRL